MANGQWRAQTSAGARSRSGGTAIQPNGHFAISDLKGQGLKPQVHATDME